MIFKIIITKINKYIIFKICVYVVRACVSSNQVTQQSNFL